MLWGKLSSEMTEARTAGGHGIGGFSELAHSERASQRKARSVFPEGENQVKNELRE